MGRKPLKIRAMSSAERQRKHRAKDKKYVAIVGFFNNQELYGDFDDHEQATAWAEAHAGQGLPITIAPMTVVKAVTLAEDMPMGSAAVN